MEETVKKRKPAKAIFLSIYILLSALIIVESCLGSSLSGDQSGFFAQLGAAIINFFHGPVTAQVIEPTKFGEASDSTYLGKGDDGLPMIALGTTTLFSIEVDYPEKASQDVYNYEYAAVLREGNADDINILQTTHGSGQKIFIDTRIVANENSSGKYTIDIKAGNDLVYPYAFHIVDLQVPTQFEIKEDAYTLKQGEGVMIDVHLLGTRGDDAYLRRYFNPRLIPGTSDHPEIASIDHGVIRGLTEGVAHITYGGYPITVSVTGEHAVIPAGNSLSIKREFPAKTPCLLDYDYVFETDENPDDYGALLYAEFDDPLLEDKDVVWTCDDPMAVKLAPHHYDEDGFPVYHDEFGKPCVRAEGYRRQKQVTIGCTSIVDPTLHAELNLEVGEALPTAMEVSFSGQADPLADLSTMVVNEQKVLTGNFNPKNTSDRRLHVDVIESDAVTVLSNDSVTVQIRASKVGTAKIRISSVANPSLVKEASIQCEAQDVINDDNYGDFHTDVRKFLGHFFLFLVTGVFGALSTFQLFKGKKPLIYGTLGCLGCGFTTAGVSELIQLFVPTRSGTWFDVGIDFAGYLLGVAIVVLIYWIIHLVRSKKQNQVLE